MPVELSADDIRAARAAVEYARSVRKLHRRRTARGSRQREADLDLALERLKAAMRPVRSARARFPYEPQTDAAESRRQVVYDLSEDIQRERRKLFKMKAHA